MGAIKHVVLGFKPYVQLKSTFNSWWHKFQIMTSPFNIYFDLVSNFRKHMKAYATVVLVCNLTLA